MTRSRSLQCSKHSEEYGRSGGRLTMSDHHLLVMFLTKDVGIRYHTILGDEKKKNMILYVHTVYLCMYDVCCIFPSVD